MAAESDRTVLARADQDQADPRMVRERLDEAGVELRDLLDAKAAPG